jgi:hypothetical protein
MTGIGEVSADPGLFNGFPGVAWTVEHLQAQLIDEEVGDPGEDVAAFLREYLEGSSELLDFSLLKGLSGLGVYALERGKRRFGRECLERVIFRLAEMAEHYSGGIAWCTPQEQLLRKVQARYAHGHFNLGMALGMPGVISVLSRAYALGFGSRDLLEGGVAWLLARRLPASEPSLFPYTFSEVDAPTGDQIAWCYGDLGVAIALLAAARSVGNPHWEAEALDVARAAAAQPIAAVRARDACLCHGTGGIAHLFNRLFHMTGHPELKMAAIKWFERTLELRTTGDSMGGYLFWSSDVEGRMAWREDPGFLTGLAGVGLALIAATTPMEPEWDRLLLANVTSRIEDHGEDVPPSRERIGRQLFTTKRDNRIDQGRSTSGDHADPYGRADENERSGQPVMGSSAFTP